MAITSPFGGKPRRKPRCGLYASKNVSVETIVDSILFANEHLDSDDINVHPLTREEVIDRVKGDTELRRNAPTAILASGDLDISIEPGRHCDYTAIKRNGDSVIVGTMKRGNDKLDWHLLTVECPA